jgi:hypothetical protein
VPTADSGTLKQRNRRDDVPGTRLQMLKKFAAFAKDKRPGTFPAVATGPPKFPTMAGPHWKNVLFDWSIPKLADLQ